MMFADGHLDALDASRTVSQQSASRQGNATEIRQAIQDANQAAREAGQIAREQAQDAAREARAMAADAKRIAEEAKASADKAPGSEQAAPGTIVIPSNSGADINISVNGKGIVVKQGDQSTTIPIHDVVPRGVVEIAYTIPLTLAVLLIGWPVGRAFAGFLNRRGRANESAVRLSADVQARLDAMERNIDTVAVEMERVSEGQRFTNKLLQERAQNGAESFVRAAERVPVQGS